MVTINQKEASLLEQKTEQIIALVCRREKQSKKKDSRVHIYLCMQFLCMLHFLGLSHLCISKAATTLHYTPFMSLEKKKNEIGSLEFETVPFSPKKFTHKNVSVFDNQKICSNDYFSLFHLPVMEIQTPFLTHNTNSFFYLCCCLL